jgi:hypothetical protein
VHYQSDEDTYHTNEESTAGSSFKSNRSGVTPEQQEEPRELNLLDHVAGLAASLGGLFTSPTNAAAAAKEHDDKSLSASTDQDDNTYGQSTLPSQDNTEKSDDWFGYMEKVLFPTQEETEYVSRLLICIPLPHKALNIFYLPSPMQNDLFTPKANTLKANIARAKLNHLALLMTILMQTRKKMRPTCSSKHWLRQEPFITFMVSNTTRIKRLML